MKALAAVLSVVVIGVVLIGGWWIWTMDVKKTEVELATRLKAQTGPVETSLFQMRTTIKNIHSCNDEWADKFIKVVALQASGRGGNKVDLPKKGETVAGVAVASAGTSLQIGRESESLGIPQELYMKLANAIEGQLGNFTAKQDTLRDVWRQHTAYCNDPWHNTLGLSLASKVQPEPEMITSEETKDAVKTKKMAEKLF